MAIPDQDVAALVQSVARQSDRELLAEIQRVAVTERGMTVELIALLMELDARRLYLAEGCSSLFTYCTQVLHLSEHAAYGRIEAARAARRFPAILERLAAGSVTLTTIGLLGRHLTLDNHLEMLDAAHRKSKREVEQFVARLHPRPDAPALVRKLPRPRQRVIRDEAAGRRAEDEPSTANALAVTEETRCVTPAVTYGRSRRVELMPLAPERYKIQFTVSRDTYEQLRRVQDLLRHSIPAGDVAAIFERALALLFAETMKTKLAAAARPRAEHRARHDSRHIPAAVKREVWQRDAGRCAFRGTRGRCTETGLLEFHHVVPFAEGGEATSDNLELRCRAHNAYEAGRWFGPRPLQMPLLREERLMWPIASSRFAPDACSR